MRYTCVINNYSMILPHEKKPPVWVQVIEELVYRQICPSVDVAHEMVQDIEELVAPVLALAAAVVAYLVVVVDSLYLTMLTM